MTQTPNVHQLNEMQRQHAESVQEMRTLTRHMRELLAHLTPNRTQEAVTFNAKPWTLSYKGRQHAYLLLPIASDINVEFPGMLGGVTLAFEAGWNNFDYPDGTQFSADTPISGLLRLSNESMTAPGGGSSGGPTSTVNQGTTPWITQISNANSNGQQPGSGSSPVVPASDWIQGQALNALAAGQVYSASFNATGPAGTINAGMALLNPNTLKNMLLIAAIASVAISQSGHTLNIATTDPWQTFGSAGPTPTPNKAGGAASVATLTTNNQLTNVVTPQGNAVASAANGGNAPFDMLANNRGILLPAGATNYAVVYVNSTGANKWFVTLVWIEF